MSIDADTAARFARIALGHVDREYPNSIGYHLAGPDDLKAPRTRHPAFFGSFDWHSCVHSWWMLLTVRRLFPDSDEAVSIAALADETFTADKIAAELDHAARPESRGFERPYGWAWLLYLHLEAERHEDRCWAKRLKPLARHFAAMWRDYLAILARPIRHGAHANTAFALRLSHEWAGRFDPDLAELIAVAAQRYYGEDRDAQCWEPGGDEFLSPTLMEAATMRRVLDGDTFAAWFADFLPRLAEFEPATLFTPAKVTDASDGKAAHLDGVNFTRAWCWRELGLDDNYAHRHIDGSLHAVDGDYMSSHWLASFATLAMLAGKGDR